MRPTFCLARTLFFAFCIFWLSLATLRGAPLELVLQTDGSSTRGNAYDSWGSALSPDQKFCASPEGAGVAIWDIQSGEKRRVLPGGGRCAWSSDGKFLGVAGEWIRIWKMPEGTLFRLEKRGQTTLAFDAKARRFVAFAAQPNEGADLRVFDLQNPGWKREIAASVRHQGMFDAPQISPDGTRVFVWSEDFSWGEKARIIGEVWNVETGKLEAQFKDGYTIRVARFSPNGKFLALGRADHRLTLWNWKSGARRELLTGPEGGVIMPVSTVAFSPDGKRLAARTDREIYGVWDVENGERLDDLPASARGTLLDWNHFETARGLFDQNGKTLLEWRAAPASVSLFAWSGKSLAHDGAGRLWAWDLGSGKLICAPQILGGASAIRLQNGALDAILARYEDSFTRAEIWRFGLPSGLLQNAISLSPAQFESEEDGRNFVPQATSPSRALGAFQNPYRKGGWSVRDLKTGRFLRSFRVPKSPNQWVFLGETVVLSFESGQNDGSGQATQTIRRHDLKTGAVSLLLQKRAPLPDYSDFLVGSSRGNFVAGVADDHPRFWRSRDWKSTPFPVGAPQFASVAFSPDEKWLATREAGGALFLRALDGNGLTAKTPIRVGVHPAETYGGREALTFSPDGRFLLSGGADGGFRVWNLALAKSHKPSLALTIWLFSGADTGRPQWLALAPDGRWLSSPGAQNWARWRVVNSSIQTPLLPLESNDTNHNPRLLSLLPTFAYSPHK